MAPLREAFGMTQKAFKIFLNLHKNTCLNDTIGARKLTL